MLRFFFGILCLSLISAVFAQNNESNLSLNLNSALKNCADNICRASQCQRLAKEHLKDKDYDKMLFYFEKELEFRHQLKDTGSLVIEKSKTYFNIISLLRNSGKYDQAEYLADESLRYNKTFLGENSPETAETYRQFAQIALAKKKPDRFNWGLNNALRIRKKEKNPDFIKIIDLLILQAEGLFEIGDLEMAESNLQEALSLFKKSKIDNEDLLARIYLSMGGIAGYSGRYAESLNFTNKALEIRLKIGRNQIGVANCYTNLGTFCLKLNQFKESASHFTQSVDILTGLLGSKNTLTIEAKSNLAYAYTELQKFDEAKKILLEIASFKNERSYYLALWRLSEIDRKTSNYTSALTYLMLTEKELIKIYGENHPKLAELYIDFGTLHLKKNELKKAKEKFELSLNINKISDRISDPLIFMSAASELINIDDKIDYSLVNKCFKLFEDIWNNCRKDTDYNIAIEKIRKFYEALLSNIYKNASSDKLPDELLLNSFESVKSLQLYAALDETEQLKRAKVPTELIDQLKNLKNSSIYYEREWLNAEFNKEISLAAKLRKTFDETELKYMKLKSDTEKKYNIPSTSLNNSGNFSSLRNKIIESELVLHYFVGDSSAYLLAFNAQKMIFKKIEYGIFKELYRFSGKMQQVEEIEQNQQKTAFEFYQSSRLISKSLLPENKLLNNISKITVIPDAAIFYLPFEVLFSEDFDCKNPSFQEMPFLIKKFAIRYAYSLQVLDKQKNPKRNLYLSAVAPLYGFENNQLQGLTNDTELNNLSNSYQGSFYKNKKISKSDLLKIINKRPDILHLAMHASAPDKGGAYFILSSDEQLAVHEISKFNLDNTAMIVLSACETGLGTQTKGEGLMSLGRAFSYSGAASVVNTLWPLHDHSAVVLMKLFYENLDKGMNKSEALRMAKLSFLNDAGNLQAHPAFWAALVLWGNDEPIKIKKRLELYLLYVTFGSMLILSISAFFVYKKIKRNKKSKRNAA